METSLTIQAVDLRTHKQGLAPCLNTCQGGGREPKIMAMRGREENGKYKQKFEMNELGLSNTLTSVQKDNLVIEPKIIKEGNYSQSGHNASSIVNANGINPTVMENHGTVTAVVEPISVAMRGRNPNNPSERGKSNGNYKQRLEMNKSGVANTITSVQKDSMVAEPMCSVHPNSHKFEFNPETSIKPISPALRATDYKAPHCVYMPEATAQGSLQGVEVAEPQENATTICLNSGDKGLEPKVMEEWKTIIGNKQMNPFRGNVEEIAPCITSACGAGGGMTPMLTDAELKTTKTKDFIEQVRGHKEMRYRIRKLTCRECFRLMGVDDADIDKIQASGISNSSQYKLAGNSIVVDVLYHIFRKAFIEKENDSQQLTLF